MTATTSGDEFDLFVGEADAEANSNAVALGAGSEAGSKANVAASYGGKAYIGNAALAHGTKAVGGSVANVVSSANATGPNSVEVANAALS